MEAAANALPEPDAGAVPGGSETILLVEDDKLMRDLTRTCLEDGGYNVLDALDGDPPFAPPASMKIRFISY